MTTWAELQNLVYVETARADLVSETNSAIWASLMKFHGKDFFFRDLAVVLFQFDQPGYLLQIDREALPYYRAMSYIRKWGPQFDSYALNPTILPPLFSNAGQPVSFNEATMKLEQLDLTDVFDSYRVEKQNVFYLAGSTINIKSSTQLAQCLVAFYQRPFITLNAGADNFANMQSWIADDYPFLIVFDAASAILQKIGMTDAARKYDNTDPNNPGLIQSQWNTVLINEIVGKGS